MILRGIVGFFKAIIDAISKVIAWLLIALGLWLPAIFCALFFITCAVTETNFKSISTLFYAGLIITTILSIWFTLSGGKSKKEKSKKSKMAPTYLSKVQEKSDRVELTTSPPRGSVFRPDSDEDLERHEQKRDYYSLKREHYDKMGRPYDEQSDRQENAYRDQRESSNYKDYRDPQYHHADNRNSQSPNDYRGNQGYRESDQAIGNYGGSHSQNGYNPSGYKSNQDYDAGGYRDSQDYQGGRRESFQPYPKYNQNPPQYDARGYQDLRGYHQDQSIRGYHQDQDPRDYRDQGQRAHNRDYERSGYQDQPRSRGKYEDEYQDEQGNNPYGFAPYKKRQPVTYQESYTPLEPQRKRESPRIFLSRKDSTLLIYEYSDRLEFYRKTQNGITHESTRYKNA